MLISDHHHKKCLESEFDTFHKDLCSLLLIPSGGERIGRRKHCTTFFERTRWSIVNQINVGTVGANSDR